MRGKTSTLSLILTHITYLYTLSRRKIVNISGDLNKVMRNEGYKKRIKIISKSIWFKVRT